MTEPRGESEAAGDATPAREAVQVGGAQPVWGAHGVGFREALRTWARIGLLSFGGPAAQIAVMHRVVVEEKRWIGEQRFLHALNFCMLLPGPEAMQLATYIGWLMHRTRGALLAGLLFILPGFVSILALSILYTSAGRGGLVEMFFYGVKPAVLAIVLQAVLRIGGRALPNGAMVLVAAAAFLAIYCFGVPFPLVVVGAIMIGVIGSGVWPRVFGPFGGGHAGGAGEKEVGREAGSGAAVKPPLLADDAELGVSRSLGRVVRVGAIWLVIWFLPLGIAAWLFGAQSTIAESGLFFSKSAVVTFGGAYAVLGYVAQHAPDAGWILQGEMLDGLGMAETTPGPLIMVLQFVGHLACYRHPPTMAEGALIELSPFWSGVVGACLATWMTFAPCFMFIFLGAPYMERLRHNRRLGGALACVTAAVVGVILSLALWFATNVLFRGETRAWRFWPMEIEVPRWASFDLWAALLALFAAYMIFRLRWGVARVVLVSLVSGVVIRVVQTFLYWNPD